MIAFLCGILFGVAIGFMIPRPHPTKCPDCGDFIDDEDYCNTCAEHAVEEWTKKYGDSPSFHASTDNLSITLGANDE